MSELERKDWSDGEPRDRVPVSITFDGIVPLDDVVYYIRSCGQRAADEIEHPTRCDVHAKRASRFEGVRCFEVHIDVAGRDYGVQAQSVDEDLYVAIWRGFDAAMRELARARHGVEPVTRSRNASAAATRHR